MTKFIEFLNSFGLNVSEDSSNLLLFACSICILAIVAFLSVVNIMLYFGVIYIFDRKEFLSKVSK